MNLINAIQTNKITSNILFVVVGNILLIISAKLQIPFYPVPITLQTFVVIALSMSMGLKLGASAVALYLFEGALGLPVFSGTPEKGIGIMYILSTTGGYLFGFLIASLFSGYIVLKKWDKYFISIFLTFLVGHAIIYSFGLLWLAKFVGFNYKLLQLGLLPFLFGDLIKSFFGALIIFGAKKLAVKN